MSLIEKYGYCPQQEEINQTLESLSKNVEGATTEQVLKTCFSMMDLTTLNSQDTPQSVEKLVKKVNEFQKSYPDFPLPASICVYSNFASVICQVRNTPEVHATVVSACFPSSQSFLEVKMLEVKMAVQAGADEIDIVLALNSFLAGDMEAAGAEIRAIRRVIDETAGGRHVCLKVILETGLLVKPELIAEASFLAMECGADFIKTSTGKVSVNATPAAAFIMCNCIKKYYEKTGRKVGFKPAGGISSASDAVSYYLIVSTVLGKEWLNKNLFRFGVSRVANALLTAVKGETVSYF